MGSSALTAESLIVRVPLSAAPDESMARARALVYAQFAAHMSIPTVEGVQRGEAFWRLKLREAAFDGEAR